ncbi:MAG: hypothetical protein KA264_11415 [Crocinitomicaceae bacterium]|nr:hypothetical protein [Crocinitomicaceae bacterium]
MSVQNFCHFHISNIFSSVSKEGVIPRTAYTPIFPDDDIEHIQINASDLVNEEITIKETLFNEIIVGRAKHYLGDNEIIRFTPF